DSDAAELPLALRVEELELFGVHEVRVRVEVVQSTVDHVLDQLTLAVGVQFTDVILVHLVKHIHQQTDNLVVLVLASHRGAVRERQGEQGNGRDGQQPGEVPACHDRMVLREGEKTWGATQELYRRWRLCATRISPAQAHGKLPVGLATTISL